MDATTTTFLGDFAGRFGFPAFLVVILLLGIWKLQERVDKQREARDLRDEEREKERRLEREADRKAHLEALAQNTASLNSVGLAVTDISRKIDDAIRPRAVR